MLLSLMNAALLLCIHLCATVDKMYPVHTPDLSYFSGPLKPLCSHRTARLSTDPALEFAVHSYQICKLYRRFVAVRCSPLGRSGCDPNVDAGQPHSGRPPCGEPSRAEPPLRPPPLPARGGPSLPGFACGDYRGKPLIRRWPRSGAGAARRRAKPRQGRRRRRGPSPLSGAGSAGTGGFAAGNPSPSARERRAESSGDTGLPGNRAAAPPPYTTSGRGGPRGGSIGLCVCVEVCAALLLLGVLGK